MPHVLIIHSKYFVVTGWLQSSGEFVITDGRLPYLEEASNIPSIRRYIWLETRLIDGIFAWKRGCLGKSELKNGFHGYSKTE